jgi:hypothetical protein
MAVLEYRSLFMSSLIQVIGPNPVVNGRTLSRHPVYPRLFSVTGIYKSLEVNIRAQAIKLRKDPNMHFRSKQPNAWKTWISDTTVLNAYGELVNNFKRAKHEKHVFEFMFGKVITGSTPKISDWAKQVDLIRTIYRTYKRVIQTLKGNRAWYSPGHLRDI